MDDRARKHTIDDAAYMARVRAETMSEVADLHRIILRHELESATEQRGRGQYLMECDGDDTAIVYSDGPTRENVAWVNHETERAAMLQPGHVHVEVIEALERADLDVVVDDVGGHQGSGCPVCGGTRTVEHAEGWTRDAPAPSAGMGDVSEITKMAGCPVCTEDL